VGLKISDATMSLSKRGAMLAIDCYTLRLASLRSREYLVTIFALDQAHSANVAYK